MATRFSTLTSIMLMSALLALHGCGGGGGDEDAGNLPAPPPPGIGAGGGTVAGPQGANVVVPAGALAVTTQIRIESSSAGAPALPTGFDALGSMFAFTPHGTVFAIPARITLPFDPATLPAGSTPVLLKTNAQGAWESVGNASFGTDSVSADVTGFSHAQVVIPKIVANLPERTWEFSTYAGDDGPATILQPPDGSGTATPGTLLEKVAAFGPAVIDATIFLPSGAVREPDGTANGMVMSTADGVTYGLFAESPRGKLGTSDPIEGVTRFTQKQSFIKRAADAKLKFTLTSVFIDLRDFSLGVAQEGLRFQGQALLSIKAYKKSDEPAFFHAAGSASLGKSGGVLVPRAENTADGKNHLWSFSSDQPEFEFFSEDTTFGPCFGRRHILKLKQPITYTVDLSSVELLEEFTVETRATASSMNRQGPDAEQDCQMSSVSTWLRDPLDLGGTSVTFEGLEPTNNPLPPPPDQELADPAACLPGPAPDPDSGVLQLDAASYATDELENAAPTITVTRTGGNRGAVTATLATLDGTAVGGVDYTPLNASVFFGDGDSGPRVLAVPILIDQLDEENETVTLTLSQPGGCAALGPQTSAVLTIVDNDLPPPSGSVGLDPGFGTAGKATAIAFGGDRSAMALQPDGKIVIVGGTFTDFIVARFNLDGSLDATFDGDGKVTTDMVSGQQEEALGVAIQGDGKIVVVGYTGAGNPKNFGLARYNVDGSLDTTFGTGGRIVSGVAGYAHAVAIQPDGRIVVVGEVAVSGQSGDFSDFAVARYDVDGSLDASFGAGGHLTTDIGDGTNTARNVVVLANGSIVVSGEPIGSFAGSDHTDVVRYDESGVPDPGFGSAGVLTLAGARVGEGLAVQDDGKLVLVGETETATPPLTRMQFAIRRLNPNGSADSSFGTAGVVSTPVSDHGDSAHSVALQADGKILVAGVSSTQTNPQFAVARYDADGSLDTAFGGAGGGRVTVDFFGFTDIAETVAVMSDGRIVLGGLARDNVDGYGIARLLP